MGTSVAIGTAQVFDALNRLLQPYSSLVQTTCGQDRLRAPTTEGSTPSTFQSRPSSSSSAASGGVGGSATTNALVGHASHCGGAACHLRTEHRAGADGHSPAQRSMVIVNHDDVALGLVDCAELGLVLGRARSCRSCVQAALLDLMCWLLLKDS